jgi:hypothetical protein
MSEPNTGKTERRDRCKRCKKLVPRSEILGRAWKSWAGHCLQCLGWEEWPHDEQRKTR